MARQPKQRNFKQGELWMADVGGDESMVMLVVSSDEFNRLPAPTVIVVPVLQHDWGLPSRVRVQDSQVTVEGAGSHLEDESFACCEQVRSIRRERLTACRGVVSQSTLEQCQRELTRLLGLRPMPRPARGWGV